MCWRRTARSAHSRPLTWGLERGSLVSAQLVDFAQRLPRLPGKPLVIVLDNASMHRRTVVKDALPILRE